MDSGRASRRATAPGSKPGERRALRVRLPPLPLLRSDATPRAPGRAVRHQSSKLDRRVRLPRGTLGNRLTGRLPDFESGGGGSNPPSRTAVPETLRGSCRLVVTPRSERGGRWFDSSPRNLTASQLTEAIRPDQGPVLKTGGGRGPLVGSSPTASASNGPGTPTAERLGLNSGACGFDSHLGTESTVQEYAAR